MTLPTFDKSQLVLAHTPPKLVTAPIHTLPCSTQQSHFWLFLSFLLCQTCSKQPSHIAGGFSWQKPSLWIQQKEGKETWYLEEGLRHSLEIRCQELHQGDAFSFTTAVVLMRFMISGFRFRDSGFGCQISVFEFLGSGFWVLGSGFWVLGSGFWVLGSGCEIWGFGIKLHGSGFRGSQI